jgi:DNA repair exonuclease SbcCD ATPase subunit
MNWPIYLTTIGLILAAAGFLHQLLVKKKEATIETLTEKNKWLQDQLDQAKNMSPDSLVEKLAKRISIQEAELERLSNDYEANESLIKTKEDELRKTRDLQVELENEMERVLKEYSALEERLDVCPYCQSELRELSYVDLSEEYGVLRRYQCGYSEIDGDIMDFCPHDPNYPEIGDFEVITSQTNAGSWATQLEGKTELAKKLQMPTVWGESPEESKSNAIAAFHERKHGMKN